MPIIKREQITKTKTVCTPDEPIEVSRELAIRASDVDEKARTVSLSFSSETPYERYFGNEILDHSPQSVRLDRLNGGAAVLVNHDTYDQRGSVVSAEINEDQRKGRAVVKISRSQLGEDLLNDIVDGIRTLVSVGYIVYKYIEEKEEGELPTVTAIDWQPLELSFVAIPADFTVGVGRSEDMPDETEQRFTGYEKIFTREKHEPIIEKKEAPKMPDEIKKPIETKTVDTGTASTMPAVPPVDVEQERRKVRTQETNRINQIREMSDAHGYAELGKEAIDNGWSYEKFNQELLVKIGEKNCEVRSEATEEKELGLTQRDKQQFSLTRLMHAVAFPNNKAAIRAASFEIEVSNEAEKLMGDEFKARGAFIPNEILQRGVPDSLQNQARQAVAQYVRDLNAGTATDGPELIADNLLAGSFIDVLRNAMVIANAGARMLPGLVGNVDIPRKTSGAAATWVTAEDGDATQSDPQFDQVTLTPKDLAVYTQVTRRLLLQSTPSIDGIVRNDLATAIALGIDAAGLYGSGASGQPEGIANTTGINTSTFAAAAPTYAETVNMIKLVMDDNALLGSLSYIIDPAGWEDSKTTEKASGTAKFIMSDDGTINGYPVAVTNQVTAEDWFFGNWSDMLIGEWGGLELNVDPYTHSLKGKIRYVLYKTVDVAVRHAVSFYHGNDTP